MVMQDGRRRSGITDDERKARLKMVGLVLDEKVKTIVAAQNGHQRSSLNHEGSRMQAHGETGTGGELLKVMSDLSGRSQGLGGKGGDERGVAGIEGNQALKIRLIDGGDPGMEDRPGR